MKSVFVPGIENLNLTRTLALRWTFVLDQSLRDGFLLDVDVYRSVLVVCSDVMAGLLVVYFLVLVR